MHPCPTSPDIAPGEHYYCRNCLNHIINQVLSNQDDPAVAGNPVMVFNNTEDAQVYANELTYSIANAEDEDFSAAAVAAMQMELDHVNAYLANPTPGED